MCGKEANTHYYYQPKKKNSQMKQINRGKLSLALTLWEMVMNG